MEIKKGLIKEGYDADLVIVDVDKKVVVDASKFASKSKILLLIRRNFTEKY